MRASAQEVSMRGLIVSSCVVVSGLIGGSPTFAQPLERPVCMVGPGGQRSCLYDSFAQCQQAIAGRSVGSDCVFNPTQFSTTGQGGIVPRPPGPGEPR
jgi:hypothetical protein